MVRYFNSAEGGTNGTTISAANSGGASGNAFTSVLIGTGAGQTFSNTQAAHGTLSHRFVNVSGQFNYVQWTDSNSDLCYVRVYMRYPTLPGAATEIVRINNAAVNNAAQLTMNASNGRLTFNINSVTAYAATAGQAMAVNTWYMVEFGINRNGGTNGPWAINCQNASTGAVLFSSSGTAASPTNQFAMLRAGKATASTVATDIFLDTITFDNTKSSLEGLYSPYKTSRFIPFFS